MTQTMGNKNRRWASWSSFKFKKTLFVPRGQLRAHSSSITTDRAMSKQKTNKNKNKNTALLPGRQYTQAQMSTNTHIYIDMYKICKVVVYYGHYIRSLYDRIQNVSTFYRLLVSEKKENVVVSGPITLNSSCLEQG